MNSLNVSKKLLLGTVAFACLVIPIVGGLALQRTAMAQEDTAGAGPRAPDNRFEGEYLPIFKPAPVYPPNAVARGLEGHVVVEYTVTADGSTENVRAVESSSSIFGEAAIQSASKYKYRPRTVNGQPQAVDGVRTRIEFVLGGGEIESNADDTPDDADSEAP